MGRSLGQQKSVHSNLLPGTFHYLDVKADNGPLIALSHVNLIDNVFTVTSFTDASDEDHLPRRSASAASAE